MSNRNVVIVQPYIPVYRTAFFDQLAQSLASDGIDLTIAAPRPPDSRSAPTDVASSAAHRPVAQRTFRMGHRAVHLRDVREPVKHADLVILEHALRNLESYRILLRYRSDTRVAFWGHGRTYTKSNSRLEEDLKTWLAKRADWFFAYTAGGADYLKSRGFPAERVTIVQNATDSARLRTAARAVPTEVVAEFRRTHSLTPGQTALYVGALEPEKRISFLLRAVELVQRHVPNFRLLVAGAGSQRQAVESAAGRAGVVYLGRQEGEALALCGAASSMMLLPGRVGLAIVDAFALGTPLFTTTWPYHAPEFEYLEHGINGYVSRNSVEAFSSDIVNHIRRPEALDRYHLSCARSAEIYTLEQMVSRFREGIIAALAARR